MIEAMTKEEEVKKSVEKVRAVNPEIIVRIRAIDNKPYYLIRYLDLSDCKLHEAYGSFNLEYVIEWLNEYFDVVDTNCGWIPCSERLPEEDKDEEYYASVIVTLDDGRVADGCYRNADKEWWADAPDGESYSENVTGRVIAWMPLPEAYKEPEK